MKGKRRANISNTLAPMKPKPAAKTTKVAQTTVRRLKVKQPPTEAFQQRLAEELELKQQRKKWRAANQKRSAAKKSKIEEAVRRGEVPKAVKPQAIFFGEQRKLKPQPTVVEVWNRWRALSPEKRKVYQVKAKKSVEDRKKSLQDIGVLKKTQDQGPLDPVGAVASGNNDTENICHTLRAGLEPLTKHFISFFVTVVPVIIDCLSQLFHKVIECDADLLHVRSIFCGKFDTATRVVGSCRCPWFLLLGCCYC